MPRQFREQQRQHAADEIKASAWQLMQQHGTAGLSLRAIARDLGLTAPALYHYFPRLEDLITALIVDAYTSLGETIENAAAAAKPAGYGPQILAGMLAYRDWALANPSAFQLILGNPIPGYSAPDALTTSVARRPILAIGRVMLAAWEAGELTLPAIVTPVPATIAAHMEAFLSAEALPIPAAVLYLNILALSRIHGIVMLESFNHIQPTIGDVATFYRHEAVAFLTELGFTLS